MAFALPIASAEALGQNMSLYSDSINPMVVRTGEDKATDIAVELLASNIPNVRVKSANNIEDLASYTKLSSHALFVVGHGHRSGMEIGDEITSWAELKDSAKSFQGIRQFYIACHSEEMISAKTTAFSGPVDAEIGAALATWQYNQIFNKDGIGINDIIEMAEAKDAGNRPVNPLYWGPTEKLWAAIDYVIWMIVTVCGAVWAQYSLRVAAACVTAELLGKALSFARVYERYLRGWMDFTSFVVATFTTVVGMAWTIISKLPFFIAAAIFGIFAAEVATGGWAIAAMLIFSLASLTVWTITALNDCYDANDIYGA